MADPSYFFHTLVTVTLVVTGLFLIIDAIREGVDRKPGDPPRRG